MFAEYVFEQSGAQYANRILLLDDSHLDETAHFSDAFSAHGFEVIRFTDDLSFRIQYEEKLKSGVGKIAILADSTTYVPYDIRRRLRVYSVSMSKLFPKLNASVLEERKPDLDLLRMAYENNYKALTSRNDTERFLRETAFSRENVERFLSCQRELLTQRARVCDNHCHWFAIADRKAYLDVIATECDALFDTTEINILFADWVTRRFGALSGEVDGETPVLVSRAMEFMREQSDKFVVIVMDGMSEFDWRVLSRSFQDIAFEKTSAFAMIPTVTSVSRQCLLSNKYPSQLLNPWSQSKEKTEFVACAKKMGFSDVQIGYARGYDADFSALTRCAAVIIMDMDDLAHSQKQGRIGMLNDVNVMVKRKALPDMVKRFLAQNFDVYISSDHGNTPCVGVGKLTGNGVEIETRSHRMLVLKDIADKENLKAKYGLREYPKYYLPKNYDYLVCDIGASLDAKGVNVMNHGGISIDEVVVPFIKIKAVRTNG